MPSSGNQLRKVQLLRWHKLCVADRACLQRLQFHNQCVGGHTSRYRPWSVIASVWLRTSPYPRPHAFFELSDEGMPGPWLGERRRSSSQSQSQTGAGALLTSLHQTCTPRRPSWSPPHSSSIRFNCLGPRAQALRRWRGLVTCNQRCERHEAAHHRATRRLPHASSVAPPATAASRQRSHTQKGRGPRPAARTPRTGAIGLRVLGTPPRNVGGGLSSRNQPNNCSYRTRVGAGEYFNSRVPCLATSQSDAAETELVL